MPTYDYQCESCQEVTEVFHGFTEDGPTECPACGADGSMRKMISAGTGVIFKGSGFYETDYKTKSGKPSTPSQKTTAEKKESKPKAKKKEKKAAKPSS